jgi:hypothetical protein
MNNQKNKSEQKWLIAATIVDMLSVTAVMSGTSGQSLQKTFAEILFCVENSSLMIINCCSDIFLNRFQLTILYMVKVF